MLNIMFKCSTLPYFYVTHVCLIFLRHRIKIRREH